MNRVIQFFNYEQCYQHYTNRIMNIRQAKIHGETIVAKPVLLVAIIDGIEGNVFKHDSVLGNAPANKLFDLVKVEKKCEGAPRAFSDYTVSIDKDALPIGVTIEELI